MWLPSVFSLTSLFFLLSFFLSFFILYFFFLPSFLHSFLPFFLSFTLSPRVVHAALWSTMPKRAREDDVEAEKPAKRQHRKHFNGKEQL